MNNSLNDYYAERIAREAARRLEEMANVTGSRINVITLVPCPFCGAHGDIFTDEKRTWGLIEHNDRCFFPSFPKHEIPECDFEAWNTRSVTAAAVMGYEAAQAERTCTNVSYRLDESRFHCSECGFGCWVKDVADGRDKLPTYCPNCGAKVVDDAES